MKKFAAVCIGMGLMLTVTGCGNNVTLNKEENDLVAEYIAGVMLKHSYENQWEYQKLEAAKKQNADNEKKTGTGSSTTNKNTVSKPTQAATIAGNTSANNTESKSNTAATTASAANKTPDSTTQNADASSDVMTAMTQALGLKGAEISYSSVTLGKRYPQGEYVVSVPANNSCVVVAVEFEIKNNSGADIVANTSSSGVTMKLGIEGTTIAKSASIIKNDITGLKGITIAPGQAYTACAIFQVPEVFADTLEGATLTVSNSGSSLGTIELK